MAGIREGSAVVTTPYEKQTWRPFVAGGTIITADALNHIEEGIYQASINTVTVDSWRLDMSGFYVGTNAASVETQSDRITSTTVAHTVRWQAPLDATVPVTVFDGTPLYSQNYYAGFTLPSGDYSTAYLQFVFDARDGMSNVEGRRQIILYSSDTETEMQIGSSRAVHVADCMYGSAITFGHMGVPGASYAVTALWPTLPSAYASGWQASVRITCW